MATQANSVGRAQHSAPTNTAWRLALAVVAWSLSIPVMAVAGSWLDRSVFRSVEAQTAMAHVMEAAIVLLAALVYWQCVPRAPGLGRRVIYLAIFVVLMTAIGYFMIDVAIVLATLLFGL